MQQVWGHPAPVEQRAEQDFLPLNGTDHIEFYVGNARQAAHYYSSAFGFRLVAYRGPETGTRELASYVLEQNKIRFVFTTPLTYDHPIVKHIVLHGDGVRDIALWVDDAWKAWHETTNRGAESVRAPETWRDAGGEARVASIATYGDTIHTFVERRNYRGAFLPGFTAVEEGDGSGVVGRAVGLKHIDHVVGNVELGEMNEWVGFYRNVMGFRLFKHFDDQDISTEYPALMSKVMTNGNERVKFPINEPAQGKRKSQIEEYLEFYHGPGVQHIAMATDNIIETVSAMRRQGVEFLRVPSTYYQDLTARIGAIDEPIDKLQDLGILVDRDDEGYMLQIFTRPVEDRPTLFYEVLQRKGSRSFGKGNFKALFEVIEREQARACAANRAWKPMARGGSLSAPTVVEAAQVPKVAPAVAPKLPPARNPRHDETSERTEQKSAFVSWLVAIVLVTGLLVVMSRLNGPRLQWIPGARNAQAVLQPKESGITPAVTAAPSSVPAIPRPTANIEDKPSPMPKGPLDGPAEHAVPMVPANTAPGPEGSSAADIPATKPRTQVSAMEPAKRLTRRAAPVPQTVMVVSSPAGATATLDGQPDVTCTTPCSLEAPPGRHTIAITMPGYQIEHRDVDVGSIAIELPPVVLRAPGGTLYLNSVPIGASISINGKNYPQLTPAQIALTPGTYNITVEKDGRQNTQSVVVQNGRLNMMKIPLE